MLNNLLSKDVFYKIKEHKIFQSIVIIAIIISAFLIGASTFEISDTLISLFLITDILITLFFVIEIIIRFIAEPNKKDLNVITSKFERYSPEECLGSEPLVPLGLSSLGYASYI